MVLARSPSLIASFPLPSRMNSNTFSTSTDERTTCSARLTQVCVHDKGSIQYDWCFTFFFSSFGKFFGTNQMRSNPNWPCLCLICIGSTLDVRIAWWQCVCVCVWYKMFQFESQSKLKRRSVTCNILAICHAVSITYSMAAGSKQLIVDAWL